LVVTLLQKLNLLRPGQRVEEQAGLESLFKSVWADNADLISVQYSGTGALKTDFTRTGKRSWQGILNDGLNSLTRYYRNNFTHGFRQVPSAQYSKTQFLFQMYTLLYDSLTSLTISNTNKQNRFW
jgi:hypothetical protein